jgi:ABC-type bacteriocin/lantibiotic exporter with double-glycine peptidase domain
MFWALFDMFFTLITMFTRNWLLALVVCASIPLVAIIIPILRESPFESVGGPPATPIQHFVGWLAEAINGSKTIKTLSIEDEFPMKPKASSMIFSTSVGGPGG